MFYVQALEGNLIFHLLDLKLLIPVLQSSPVSPALPSVPIAFVNEVHGLGRGLESVLESELQLQAIPCFFLSSGVCKRKQTGAWSKE